MKKPKYIGRLATAIPFSRASSRKDELAERMILLLDHYKITPIEQPKEPLCWYVLAWKLALDYVPGFRVSENPRGRGRPRKRPRTLAELAPKRKRGRPSKEIDPERFVRVIDAAKQELSAAKNRRVTDKEVLEIIVEKIAKDKGHSVTRAKATGLPKLQKRLSRARRNSNKSK